MSKSQKQTLREFLFDRTNSYLLRWHNTPTFPKESLAEHHFYTARIAYWIAQTFWWNENATELSHADYIFPADVAILALFHDEPEKIIGDIPGSMKSLVPGARETIKEWEEFGLSVILERAPKEVSPVLGVLCEEAENRATMAGQIVRYADTLAALSYIEDQIVMGNDHPRTYELQQALLEQATECKWGWLWKLRGQYPELP